MELQVTVTLSDRLFSLLEDKLPNLGRRIEKAVTKEVGAQTRRESNIAVAVVATPAETHLPDAESIPAPEAIDQPSAPQEITPEAARKVLGETRRRLLGEDYESQKGTPKYKAITGIAKQIIMMVSEGRATTIPSLSSEERIKFVNECKSLVLDENGFPSYPPPTF